MKKLKQMSGPYSIGFELSSTAHGFVATDPNGNVLYHGKQPVMGTRVFKEGQHAAEARMPRTSRRGIQRRRGREHEMERVFAPVISPIDPDFFIRRRMSYKLGKIRFESDPIGFSYSCLFHSFPTLAHLDVALMESDSAMDPRLIFEAVANHVVRRGHFLLENQNVSSEHIVWPDNQYVRLVELFIDRKRTRGKKYWFSAIEAGFVANGRYDQWVKYVWDGKPENMLSV